MFPAAEQPPEWPRHKVLPRGGIEHEITDNFPRSEIDFHQLSREFTRRDRKAIVRRELDVIETFTGNGYGLDQRHRVRITEIDATPRLGDHHRVFAIRRKVEIV